MASYQVYCTECDIECSIMTFEAVDAVPKICSFCGTELDDTNIREDDDENEEDAWDKLTEETLNDLDDWKS